MTDSAKLLTPQLAILWLPLGYAQAYAQDLAVLPATASIQGDTQGKIELGKKLFFDPRLSATGTVSCDSCHNLMVVQRRWASTV